MPNTMIIYLYLIGRHNILSEAKILLYLRLPLLIEERAYKVCEILRDI